MGYWSNWFSSKSLPLHERGVPTNAPNPPPRDQGPATGPPEASQRPQEALERQKLVLTFSEVATGLGILSGLNPGMVQEATAKAMIYKAKSIFEKAGQPPTGVMVPIELVIVPG